MYQLIICFVKKGLFLAYKIIKHRINNLHILQVFGQYFTTFKFSLVFLHNFQANKKYPTPNANIHGELTTFARKSSLISRLLNTEKFYQ